jgi:hypothetical protein
MEPQSALRTWEKILEILDDKLQYGFLEQARSVVDVKISGGDVTLLVSTPEAKEFFQAEVNQHRLMIMSRPVLTIDKISVQLVEADALR